MNKKIILAVIAVIAIVAVVAVSGCIWDENKISEEEAIELVTAHIENEYNTTKISEINVNLTTYEGHDVYHVTATVELPKNSSDNNKEWTTSNNYADFFKETDYVSYYVDIKDGTIIHHESSPGNRIE